MFNGIGSRIWVDEALVKNKQDLIVDRNGGSSYCGITYNTPIASSGIERDNIEILADNGKTFAVWEAELYDVVISEGDDVTVHLVPYLRQSDNEPGMMDVLTDDFYTNRGIGVFTAGPDIN